MVGLHPKNQQVHYVKYKSYNLDNVFLEGDDVGSFLIVSWIVVHQISLHFWEENQEENGDQVQAERGHQAGHNVCAVLLVEELDHNLDVRGHEDILILLSQELFQKEQAFLIIYYPICSHTLYVDCIS